MEKSPEEILQIVNKIRNDVTSKKKGSIYHDKLFAVSGGNILFKKSFFTTYKLQKYLKTIIFRSLSERRNYIANLHNGDGTRQVVWGLLPDNHGRDLDSSSIPNDLVVMNFQFDDMLFKHDTKMNESNNLIKGLLRESLLTEVYVSDNQLKGLENELDGLFANIDIDVDFTQHFMDRVRDKRNVKDITIEELRQIFKNVYSKYKEVLSDYRNGFEGVFRNNPTAINIPFTLQWDKAAKELDLVAKTTMRKKDFKSDTPFLNVNDATPVKKKEVTQKEKFRKIKLTSGDVVKYYEMANKFETLRDEEINIDDIFDFLPEELQNKVMELSENLEEDYPQSWNIEEFKTLTSFNARIKYCEQHLQRISSGSSRIVYKIDDEKVLKLAKNKKGLAQNEVEIEYSQYYDIEGLVARVFNHHPNNLWVEMELGRKVTKGNFKQITGLNFDEYGYMLKKHHHDANGRGPNPFSVSQETVDEMWENEFSYGMLDFIGNYAVPAGDLARTSSYGLVKRDGRDTIVLIDYGLSSDIYDSYYS